MFCTGVRRGYSDGACRFVPASNKRVLGDTVSPAELHRGLCALPASEWVRTSLHITFVRLIINSSRSTPSLWTQVREGPNCFLPQRDSGAVWAERAKLHSSLQLWHVSLHRWSPWPLSALHCAAVWTTRPRVLHSCETFLLLGGPKKLGPKCIHVWLSFKLKIISVRTISGCMDDFKCCNIFFSYICSLSIKQLFSPFLQNCNSISKREAMRADPSQGLLSYGPIRIEAPDRSRSSKLLFP